MLSYETADTDCYQSEGTPTSAKNSCTTGDGLREGERSD